MGLDEERRLSRGVKHGLAELGVVELAVEALTGHELPVGAAFHHVAIPHHQDAVGVLDGGEAVGHHEAGFILHQAAHGGADLLLGTGVHVGGGLV